MRQLVLLISLFASINFLSAQTREETGWLMMANSTKLSKSFGLHLDMQFRTADDGDYLRNFMFRPGLVYLINKKSNLTLGYLLNDTYSKLEGDLDNRLSEHRIWEQFVYNQAIGRQTVTHRFRMEQRFIERRATDLFSQRFRYFFRTLVPFTKQDSAFKKGSFLALQNEVFLHLQNKDELNNHVFDQNRAYIAFGYRFSPKIDIEAGYLNQAIKGASNNTVNNVVQLALYTRF